MTKTLLHLHELRSNSTLISQTYCGLDLNMSKAEVLDIRDPSLDKELKLRICNYIHHLVYKEKVYRFCRTCLSEEEEGLLLLFIQSLI